MMPTSDRHRRPHAGSSQPRDTRRGYALLIALLLLGLATMTFGWNLRRLNVYGASIDLRADGYRDHHEQLSVRDIAAVWLARVQQEVEDEELLTIAGDGRPDFEIALPQGTLLELFLHDGQAGFLVNLSLAVNDEHEREMLRVLAALPPDRPDLVRMAGPRNISIRNADDTLIEAIAAGQSDLTAALRALREQPDMNRGRINNTFNAMGVDPTDIPLSASWLAFQPNLWAIDIRATTPDAPRAADTAPRWYRVLIETQGRQGEIREWRRLTEREFNLARGPGFDPANPANR